jgi:UDP-glucuronate decarboxylase
MHPNDGRVVSNFIMQALQGEPITIFGKGAQTRSFCYVTDLVDGLIRLMGSPDNVTGPINLGNPDEKTILELAEIVVRLSGSKSKIIFKDLPADDPVRRCPSITKARKSLKWQPKVLLEDGLKETIDYFKWYIKRGSGARDTSRQTVKHVRETV